MDQPESQVATSTPKPDTEKELFRTLWPKRCGIPLRFSFKTLGSLVGLQKETELALDALNSKQSIFITGECGTGKTHLAVGLILSLFDEHYAKSRECIESGRPISDPPVFIPSVEFFLQIKSTWDKDADETEGRVLDRYSSCSLLVIDDLGVEKVSDWSRQLFYTLLNRRYLGLQQTIITTNLSLDEVARSIDDRIASRITEMGIVLKLNGGDYRLKRRG